MLTNVNAIRIRHKIEKVHFRCWEVRLLTLFFKMREALCCNLYSVIFTLYSLLCTLYSVIFTKGDYSFTSSVRATVTVVVVTFRYLIWLSPFTRR